MIETYIFSSTLKEFFRVRRVIWWVFIVLAVFGISFIFASRLTSVSRQDAYTLLSASLAFRILPLCAAIYSTSVVNQEVTQKTIVYLLTRPIPRWKLLVFRTLAAMVVVAVISSVAELAVGLAVGSSQSALLPHDLAAICAGAATYTALFTLVSLFVNRPMVVCLLFAFVWETAVPNMPGDLYRLTVSGYLSSIAHRPVLQSAGGMDAIAGLLGVNVITPALAWGSVLGLTLACLGLGSFWFSNFEYMAREDD